MEGILDVGGGVCLCEVSVSKKVLKLRLKKKVDQKRSLKKATVTLAELCLGSPREERRKCQGRKCAKC